MKLKQAAMAFVQWVFRQASDAHLQTMGPIILSGLLKLLEQLGDDKSTCFVFLFFVFCFCLFCCCSFVNLIDWYLTNFLFPGKDANELKSFTYNAIGLLGKRVKVP
jgi:hypothetical protein